MTLFKLFWLIMIELDMTNTPLKVISLAKRIFSVRGLWIFAQKCRFFGNVDYMISYVLSECNKKVQIILWNNTTPLWVFSGCNRQLGFRPSTKAILIKKRFQFALYHPHRFKRGAPRLSKASHIFSQKKSDYHLYRAELYILVRKYWAQ